MRTHSKHQRKPSFHIWFRMSYHGVTKLNSCEKGVKTTPNITQPFLTNSECSKPTILADRVRSPLGSNNFFCGLKITSDCRLLWQVFHVFMGHVVKWLNSTTHCMFQTSYYPFLSTYSITSQTRNRNQMWNIWGYWTGIQDVWCCERPYPNRKYKLLQRYYYSRKNLHSNWQLNWVILRQEDCEKDRLLQFRQFQNQYPIQIWNICGYWTGIQNAWYWSHSIQPEIYNIAEELLR